MYDSKTVGEAYSSLLISKEKMIKAIHQEAIANFLMNVPGLSSITWDFSYYKGSSDMPYQFCFSPDDVFLNGIHVDEFLEKNPSLKKKCLKIIDWSYCFYENLEILKMVFGACGSVVMTIDSIKFDLGNECFCSS